MTLFDIFENYHITPQFPPAVQKQLKNLPDEVQEKDLKGRLDLTELLTFTIDGDDAKDFDDAVSLEKNEKGNYVLGVHIADVSHYVTENSPVDRAAFARGTSVYLIDTVVPMLPFELSNELCSLKPNVIRLTLSVFMEISPRGALKSYSIHESYIKSSYRMTYKNVTEILNGNKELCEKYAPLLSILKDMLKLSRILKKKREMRGAIEFVTRESKVTLDKNGHAVNVERYPISESNSIIEEFMLIANETVAKHMSEKRLPAVFRVHEEPSEEKIERLLTTLPFLGINSALSEGRKPKDFQKIVKESNGMEKENIINYIVLRSMSKAQYSEVNKGHFGLAAKYYCHFTSPIRRYPDLITHRIIKASIHKKLDEKNIDRYMTAVMSAAVTSTATEINAADAEAEWKKIKKIEYMEDKVGEVFEGNISHVTANGFFVELDNTVEGFVAARTIEDDVYILLENKLALEGINTKNSYSVGDRVKVKVDFADSDAGLLDFLICSKKRTVKRRVNTKAQSKAIRAIKKESRELREERDKKRYKLDYAAEQAWVKANRDILKPFTESIAVKKNELRFVRISFEDFWHISVSPIIREFGAGDSGDNFEKYINASKFAFENFVFEMCDSLGKPLDRDFIEKKKQIIEKILNGILRELK